MNEIIVGIGQYAHRSLDGGSTWVRTLREIPGRHTPVVCGTVDLAELPSRPPRTIWDAVWVLPDGFGVAMNHEVTDADPASPNAPSSLAHVFRTNDGGRTWHELQLNVRWKLTQAIRRATMSWPVEEFNALVLTPDTVVLSWEDPWIYDGSRSHMIFSLDHGESWRYNGLGYSYAYLTSDGSGRLMTWIGDFILESSDGGKQWTKRAFTVEWSPEFRHIKANALRHVTFAEPDVAFSLFVHWRHGGSFAPAHVGLLRTTDHGTLWREIQVFQGPDVGDVNERHMLTLQVR
jgi:hypothetical protein